MKIKEGGDWNVRPVAVLRRLTGKCLCSVTKIKASQFFSSSPIWSGKSWWVSKDSAQASLLH